jgi:hypothetical protein
MESPGINVVTSGRTGNEDSSPDNDAVLLPELVEQVGVPDEVVEVSLVSTMRQHRFDGVGTDPPFLCFGLKTVPFSSIDRLPDRFPIHTLEEAALIPRPDVDEVAFTGSLGEQFDRQTQLQRGGSPLLGSQVVDPPMLVLQPLHEPVETA